MMKSISFPLSALLIALTALSCSSDDGPALPQPAALIFPQQLSECTTGVDLGGTTSRVSFEWEAADNTFDYELSVINLDDPADSQTFETEDTRFDVVLRKANGYRWTVTSRNEDGTQTAQSEEWMFINAGSLSSYPPFPATLSAPGIGARLETPPGGQVTLQWSVTDLDNDVNLIEIYAGTATEPALFESLVAGSTSVPFPVTSGQRYYWQIQVTDRAGNRSVSQIRDFLIE